MFVAATQWLDAELWFTAGMLGYLAGGIAAGICLYTYLEHPPPQHAAFAPSTPPLAQPAYDRLAAPAGESN